MLSKEVENTLADAFQQAREAGHGHLTIEHLLLLILDTPNVCEVLRACRGDPVLLKQELESHLNESTPPRLDANERRELEVQPMIGLQRVLQRAVFHVQSGGRQEVGFADVLVGIFGEKNSHAAHLLNRHDIRRADVVNYISRSSSVRPNSAPANYGNSPTPTRRSFIGSTLGATAVLKLTAESPFAQASSAPPPEMNPHDTTHVTLSVTAAPPDLFRLECAVTDCEIEGKLPADLNGIFYRVGPDAQFPMNPHNIPFDGEGHASMFRFENGRVSFRSRFVRNQRYKAQAAAHKILFPMYRNPALDDPSVQGVSRGTANTHILYWRGKLLAFKEDSPPVALHPLTLETLDDYYTFDGQLESKTFTAHPKIDALTGNMVAFGYEGRGFGSDDVNVFEYTPQGKRVWNTWIKVPYVGMLHDFAVTQKHIVFYVIPLAIDHEQMARGGIHWSWDGSKPTYFGFMRRGGDGKDLQWVKGPTRSATHVMGAFDNGQRIIVDVEMSEFNPFPFMPFRDGTRWDPIRGASRITRLSVDLSHKTPQEYQIETLYPNYLGGLPRMDDRYLTVPYRFGFLPCQEAGVAGFGSNCYARFDHQTRATQIYKAPADTTLAEACFAPKSQSAPEASGYLMGVATRMKEGGRSDLLVFDAERLSDGPIATVRLPTRVVGQIHGWWVPGEQLPVDSAA